MIHKSRNTSVIAFLNKGKVRDFTANATFIVVTSPSYGLIDMIFKSTFNLYMKGK